MLYLGGYPLFLSNYISYKCPIETASS